MVYVKLAEVQNKLAVPKGQRNDFGKFNYRSCEDILKAVKPILDSLGCVVIMTNDMKCIGDRNYVEAKATFVDLETGEKIESIAHAREDAQKKGMDGSQITGAASSYARKYALAGLFCIDNEKDADTNEYTKKTKAEPKTKEEATLQSKMDLIKKYIKKDENYDKYIEYIRKHNIQGEKDLTEAHADAIIKLF